MNFSMAPSELGKGYLSPVTAPEWATVPRQGVYGTAVLDAWAEPGRAA